MPLCAEIAVNNQPLNLSKYPITKTGILLNMVVLRYTVYV